MTAMRTGRRGRDFGLVGSGRMGTVYVLHFDEKIAHARHYTGWGGDLERRMREHAAGRGARLTEVAVDRGIGWVVAHTEPGDRYRERQLKNYGGAARYCPVCTGAVDPTTLPHYGGTTS